MKSDPDIQFALDCLSAPIDRSIQKQLRNTPTVWIGSGLSRVAAELGASVTRTAGGVASAMTPFDFCQLQGTAYLPVIVSYSGGNSDSISVAEHIAERYQRAVMITAQPESKCAQLLRDAGVELKIITYPPHRKEKRFVALMPFIGACSLSYRLAGGDECEAKVGLQTIVAGRSLKEICPRSKHHWVILAAGTSRIAALAWQVFLSESALVDALVVDIKDYTHARYLSALRQPNSSFLILSDDQSSNLADTVQKRLCDFGCTPKIHISGTRDQALWGHLAHVVELIGPLCQKEGWDLDNPPKPKQMRHWGNWGVIRRCKGDIK